MLISIRLVEIPAYLTVMFLVEKIGRRIIINLTLLIGGAFCLAAGLTSKGGKMGMNIIQFWFWTEAQVIFLFFI